MTLDLRQPAWGARAGLGARKAGEMTVDLERAGRGRRERRCFAVGACRGVEGRAQAPDPGSPWDPQREHALPAEDAPTFDVAGADLAGTLVPAMAAAAAKPALPFAKPRPVAATEEVGTSAR
ncbi:MAG: hypothetical protein R3F14_23980 [Polyangiaceae bacterium]